MLSKVIKTVNKLTAPAATNPNFRDVAVLLQGDGTSGAQNNTFIDSSTNNFTITRNGNTTQGAFSPYGSSWSNYFDGNGDYLDVGSTAYNMAGNWTVEFWFNASNTGSIFFDCRPDSTNGYYPELSISSSTQLDFYFNSSSHFFTVPQFLNTWNHVAIVKNSTTITIYFNGSSVYTVADANTWGVGTSRPRIGANGGFYSGAPAVLAGYISNLRIVNGTAVYTANFTPPTAPLTAVAGTSLLTCQANRFRDASSSNLTITPAGNVNVQRFSPFAPAVEYSTTTNGGSGYFDGAGDYLSAASNTGLNPEAGAFTWECWFYPTAAWYQGSTDSAMLFLTDVTGGLQISRADTSQGNTWGVCSFFVSWRILSTTLPIVGQWNHLAVSRTGIGTNQGALFLNGSRLAQGTISDTFAQGVVYFGGGVHANAAESTGYISDMRFVKGTAIYDPTISTYTIPTTPLTAITNTQLLLGFKNAGIYDNAAMVDYETIGSAQIDTTIKKFGTGSLKFNGTTDALKTPNNALFNFGTGDFTIEFWLYSAIPWTSQSATAGLLSNKGSDTDNAWEILRPGTAFILARFALENNFSTTSTPATATWEHWALTRSGTTLRWFKNGVLDATGTNSANIQSANPFYIGYTNRYGSYFNGNIDGLRITKGVCLYTTTFTPPTVAFPNTDTAGEASYTTPGTYSWTAPTNVNSVSVVCVGGGGGSAGGASNGGAGGGGALAYRNNISVTPGNSYTIIVGSAGGTGNPNGGTGGSSSAFSCVAGGGQGGQGITGGTGGAISGTYSAGYAGGSGGAGNSFGGGGGGAGGYAGVGGAGGSSSGTATNGSAGSGGGGGGGASGPNSTDWQGGGGGGVGVLGQGSNGAGGTTGAKSTNLSGKGGSGGTDGRIGAISAGTGGLYGGGATGGGPADPGAIGAVRIIWGSSRAFPSTNTGNI